MNLPRVFSWPRRGAARLSLLVLPWLGACAPPVLLNTPAPPLPATFAQGSAVGVEVDATQVHWKRFFRDARLQALVDAALVHNRDLRLAASRVEEARAQHALARADRLPSLNLLGTARVDQTYAPNLSVGPERRLDLNLSSASFELDFFGRLASLSAAARANLLATEEARRVTELALIAQVAELYYAQRHTQELLARARQAVASRAQTLEILERARQIGMVYDLELEQARVLLETARAQRAQLGHASNQIDNLLLLLVGELPGQLPEGLPLDALLQHDALAVGIPAEVLLLRPDVMAAEHRLGAAQANIRAARAAFFPRVTLTAGLGVASAGLAGLFKAGAWAFQPSLSMPLFDGGRAKASFDLSVAREVAAVAQYERTVQQAFREVSDQLSARDSLAVQMGAAQRILQAHQQRLQIQQQRFSAGLTGYLEVLEAEREVWAASQSTTQLRRTQLEASIGLYKALGGGSAVARASGEPRPPPKRAEDRQPQPLLSSASAHQRP
jgi:outer membrane protein, multidrug efflux system